MEASTLLYIILIPALMLGFVCGIGLFVQIKEKLYLSALGFLLVLYMITGKGFAYLGIAPLYISEMVFALGCFTVVLIALLRGRLYIGAINHPSAFLLILFMVWGAARTLPYLTVHGLDALRDGVIWGYAIFAFCFALLVTRERLDALFGLYSRLLPFLLVGMVISYIAVRSVALPSVPNSPVPIINLKAGDAGVHLAGMAAFLLMRLDRVYGKPYPKWLLWLLWIFWGMALIFYGSIGRGGLMSALLGLAMAFLLRPKLAGWVRPAALLTLLLVVLFLVDVTGLYEPPAHVRRQLSVEQIITNFTSVFGGPSRGDQELTVAWRLSWWKRIVNYTLFDPNGEYFLGGKGYGINLSIDDGFPSPAGAPPNRHPHNITMNILARSGVVGLALWLMFLVAHGWRLFKATTRAGFAGRTATWLLTYWLAFLFNAQVDVFFENPIGGIWFWTLVGVGWVFIYRKWQPQAQFAPVSSPISGSLQVARPPM